MSHPKILKDVCELIVDCEHKTAPTQATGYPSIRTPNIGKGKLILDGVNRVSEETYKAWTQRAVPQADDLILAREAPIGNVAIISKNLKVCLGQRTVLIRPDKTKVYPRYLCYLILGDEVQGKIRGVSNGATVHHLNMADIRGFELPRLPHLSMQRRIADILSAYDDLIENNTRRIKILEEMAQLLYREWFVNFSFPGHQDVPLVESELGLIPQGWMVKRLEDLTEPQRQITYGVVKPGEHDENGIPFIRGGDISQGEILISKLRTITKQVSDVYKRTLLKGGEILVSLVGNPGEVGIVPSCLEGANIARQVGMIALQDRANASYVLRFLMSHKGHQELFASTTGSVQKVINLSSLKRVRISIPSSYLLSKANSILDDIHQQQRVLRDKNTVLGKTRDLLLPKLISGEIDIEALNTSVIEEVQAA